MKWLGLVVCLALVSVAQGRDDEDARLIVAAYSTKTAIILTTTTTTTPFTCAFKTNGAVCQRRRYRRYTKLDDSVLSDDTRPEVSGSLGEETVKNERQPRIALTIWTTVSSTYTVTSTSTNRSTTFSLSFFCTVSGAVLPPGCG
nr:uncharacterized protein LOC128694997 [Cherax quadricarinatus]XP_053641357.1 uncharacterized protein LOC128694997 [Cherax quadricarinatus]XP_053641358.1 uncharacterized protein LOC128694997 [Cherax quadricarinatus]